MNINDLINNMPKIDVPKIDSIIEQRNNLNVKMTEEIQEKMSKISEEKHKREVENNENLKSIVKHSEEISNYNKQLVSLNEKILNKINSLNDSLSFLIDAFSDKTEKDKEYSQQHLALLLELIKIIDEKDSSKLQTFMNSVGFPLGVGLLTEALKIKLGLS